MTSDDYLKTQGLIGHNEQYETLYLAEEEIEKFMANYLKENPGTEIETRYINHPPIQMTQNIEVRWLRPETPEIPPIIIKEIDTVEPELPPIRIVEKRKEKEENVEPVIIREKPPFIVIPEPKIAYVQNLAKKDVKQDKQETKFEGRPIKIEHVRSESQGSFNHSTSTNTKTRYDFDEQYKRDRLYSFEEHASIIDYEEEEYDEVPEDTFRSKIRYEDEHELRLYEEKLKQTLYEEYLLRLERERLERKLSKSGLFEERLRERSISQERMSHLSNRLSTTRIREEEPRLRQVREHEMKQHIIKERHTQSLDSQLSETSSFRNIKFSKVTNQEDLKRYNQILFDPNSLSFQSSKDTGLIESSLTNMDQAYSNTTSNDFSYVRQSDFYNIRQPNMAADGNNVRFLESILSA